MEKKTKAQLVKEQIEKRNKKILGAKPKSPVRVVKK